VIYHLLYPLKSIIPPFNVFRYVSFRTAMAAVTAFVICLLIGPRVIAFLQKKDVKEKAWKSDSEKLSDMHRHKQQVPTMGGVIILVAILISSFLWGRLDNTFIQLSLLCTVGFGIVGLIDDFIKLTYEDRQGLSKRRKFLLQFALSAALSFAIFRLLVAASGPESMNLYFPFFKNLVLDLSIVGGVGAFILTLMVIVGFSNAVNLTDGLDGLAAGCVLIASSAMAVICYLVGRVDYSAYLNLLYVRGCSEMTIFCAAIAGASAGFLWFNCYPAKVFMGDTGSLALGGILGFIAVATKQEIMLFIVGGIFMIEVLSVVIQVASFKLRGGKRVFLIAPLHHHFQFKGDHEAKVTVRFWIVAGILAVIGLATLKLR
jgi:phospho-N-acetylmuramoyl-pentapeptide-transferase